MRFIYVDSYLLDTIDRVLAKLWYFSKKSKNMIANNKQIWVHITNYNYRHDDSSISKTEESDVIDIPPQNYFQNNIPELTLPLNEESPSFEDNNTKDSNSSAK